MNELLFSAMDMPKEVQKVLDKVVDSVCKGMTIFERKAYDLGVLNALGTMRSLLELDEEPVIHVSGLDVIVEMDIKELEEIFLK